MKSTDSLSRDKLLGMYRTMVTIRTFETREAQIYRKGLQPGFVHLYLGEEAVATGVCAALRKDDFITFHEPGKNLRSLLLGENRPVWAFQAPNRTVAVDSNNQDIPERPGFFQITNVTDMEEVETTIGEDYLFPLRLHFSNDLGKLFSCPDLFPHLDLPIQNLPDLTQGVNPSAEVNFS